MDIRVRVGCLVFVLLLSACATETSANETVIAALRQTAEAEAFQSRVTGSSGGMQLIEDVTAQGDSTSLDMAVIEDGSRRALLSVRRIGAAVFVLDTRESDAAWQQFHIDDVPNEYGEWVEASMSPYLNEDPVGVAEALPVHFRQVDGAEPDGNVYESRTDDDVVPMTVELDRQGRVREIVLRLGTSNVVIEVTTYSPNPVTAPGN